MFTLDSSKLLKNTHRTVFLSDWHIGNAEAVRKKIRAAVEYCVQENIDRVWLGGDMCESIYLTDKRYSPDVHSGVFATAEAQVHEVVEILEPIADKIGCYLDGNHEEKYIHVIDSAALVCRELYTRYGVSVPHMGRSVRIKINEKDFYLFTHGSGSIRKSMAGDVKQIVTNELIKIKRTLRKQPGDDCILSVTGHHHKVGVHDPEQRLAFGGGLNFKQVYPKRLQCPTTGVIPEEFRWFAMTGGFLKGVVISEQFDETFDMADVVSGKKKLKRVTSYVEKAGMQLVEMGFIVATVNKCVFQKAEVVIL